MVWGSGSYIVGEIIDNIKMNKIGQDHPELISQFYRAIIEVFEANDCYTLDEVDDKLFKREYKKYLKENKYV
jgi:hypothetical protein